jgi:hypothetical protein
MYYLIQIPVGWDDLYLWVPQPVQTWGLPANLQVGIRMGLKPVGHDQTQEI